MKIFLFSKGYTEIKSVDEIIIENYWTNINCVNVREMAIFPSPYICRFYRSFILDKAHMY